MFLTWRECALFCHRADAHIYVFCAAFASKFATTTFHHTTPPHPHHAAAHTHTRSSLINRSSIHICIELIRSESCHLHLRHPHTDARSLRRGGGPSLLAPRQTGPKRPEAQRARARECCCKITGCKHIICHVNDRLSPFVSSSSSLFFSASSSSSSSSSFCLHYCVCVCRLSDRLVSVLLCWDTDSLFLCSVLNSSPIVLSCKFLKDTLPFPLLKNTRCDFVFCARQRPDKSPRFPAKHAAVVFEKLVGNSGHFWGAAAHQRVRPESDSLWFL